MQKELRSRRTGTNAGDVATLFLDVFGNGLGVKSDGGIEIGKQYNQNEVKKSVSYLILNKIVDKIEKRCYPKDVPDQGT